MKRTLFPLVVLSFVLLVSSSGFAQEKRPAVQIINSSPTIRALDSNIFTVERLSLQNFGKELLLQFTISNSSKETTSGTRFVITGYNKSGQVMSQSTMAFPDEIRANSKLLSYIDLGSMMKGADSYTAEFAPRSRTRVRMNDDDFATEDCTTCANNAAKLCINGTETYSCSVGPVFDCKFTCHFPT